MKYLFVLLALSALVCTIFAAPASTNLQQKDTDSADDKFLDMLSRVTKASHQSDEDADDIPAEMQWGFFKKLFRKVRPYKPLIKKLVGDAIRGAIRSHMSPQQSKEDEESAVVEAVLKSELESIAKEQGDDYDDGGDAKASQSDDDDDDNTPAEVQWGFFKRAFRKLRRNKLLKKVAGRAFNHAVRLYMPGYKGEENALIEAVLNSELEGIAEEQGDDYDDGE